VIRTARPSDLPRYAIIERAAAALYAPWGLDAAFEETSTPTARVRAAIERRELIAATNEDDVMIGYALLEIDGAEVHLEELAVEPTVGRRGHGSALLEATVALAAAEKARRVTLVTLDFVPFGKVFYERRGFVSIAREELPSHLQDLLPSVGHDGRVAMQRTI